jgi:hypothetical protein
MLETVAAGLILAAVSGITYLAYKHPPAFRKLLFLLAPLLMLSQLLLAAWDLGISRAFTVLYPLVDPAKWQEASAGIDSIRPRWWLASIIFLSSWVYIGFLASLPLLIHDKKEAKPDHESPKEKD